ncbi:uncharacterized protein LOC133324946, partial [Musca vetustissima]|uniref:uncharacterized protein LOC133324946 n=1 Tax=Musca vetustissima TaxID=27455 RepID=UPI002AB638E9
VIDWGVEQCRSLHVHIKSPPRLRVDPASVTLHKGDSLRVRCLSPGNDDIKRYAQLGYSWSRNGQLFQSDPKTVMWEDLYPDGSILKINNIQKSAEYTCVVSNTVKPVSKSVYITVIDRSAVHVCHAETAYGVHWPTSAPGGVPVISDCPRGFEGFSKRTCEKRDAGNTTWLTPDFSNCIRDHLLKIYNKFRALTSGFQQTNTSDLLKASLDYTLRRYKHFLPGEAGFLIDMLHELDNYLQLKGTQLEREMAAEIILHILDKVMQNPQSLNSQQQIKKLQLLTQSAALNRETIAASQLATSTSTGSITQSAAASSGSSTSATGSLASSSASSSSSSSSSILTLTQPSRIDPIEDANILKASTGVAGSSGSNLRVVATATGNNRQTLLKTDISQSVGNGATAAVATGTMDVAAGMGGGAVGPNSILTVDEDSLSLDRLNSLRIYMTSIKTLPFNLRIYGDDLFSDQLYMDIGLSNRLLNIMANNTIFASVISYKNLKSFLPKTYYTRGSDPKESDYILASRIIQTWLFQSNRSNDNLREPLDLPFEHGHVEIIFQHERAPKDSDWIAVCGHDYKASFESSWRSDLCITKNLMENITRCICPVSGTYVVMLTKRNNHSHHLNTPPRPMFVIISCVCCLLQSCSAFIILLPIWFNRQCAITFLKMQFCVSTSSIMVIFLLGFLKMLPVNWQPVISSSLASLLLLGISTLIAIALVIHSELVPKKVIHQQQQQHHHQLNKKPATPAATTTTTTPAATATNIMATVAGSATPPQQKTTTAVQKKTKHSTKMDQEKATTPLSLASSSSASATSDSLASSNNISITQISATTTPVHNTRKDSEASRGNDGNSQHTLLRRSASALLKPPARFSKTTTRGSGSGSGGKQMTMAASGVRGAIGISWLLPLLFAITSPLICTINGKWPQNWWLEIMSHSMNSGAVTAMGTMTTTAATSGVGGYSTTTTSASTTTTITDGFTQLRNHFSTTEPPLLTNGDSVLEFNTTTTMQSADMATITATSYSSKAATSPATTFWSSSSTRPQNPHISLHSMFNMDHNEDIYAVGGDPTISSSATSPAMIGPSMSFILFLCVDILFILLFFALFAILIKKLLWLWHKNRRGTNNALAHQLDKFNTAMRQRIGLLYRTGCLLLIKLCTDALFIVYSNTTTITLETWWCYPFGISCILMGFTILSCFVIKPESPLRNHKGALGRYSSSDNLKKKQLSSSKTSLDDNYCTGTINTPISFYTNHEKESELSSSAPPLMHKTPPSPARRHQLELSAVVASAAGAAACQMPGLTIISTAPRCQMLPLQEQLQQHHPHHHQHVASVETFIGPTPSLPPSSMAITLNNGSATATACGGAGGTLERKSAGKHMMTCLQQQQQQHHQHGNNLQSSIASGTSSATLTSITSPRAMRCCNLLGGEQRITAAGNCMQQPQHHIAVMPQVVSGSSMGYYDAYGAGITSATPASSTSSSSALTSSMTGSLSRRSHLSATHASHQQQLASSGDYIGVEHLDILQNVAGDTIIGLRSTGNTMGVCPTATSYHHQAQMLPTGATIVSISGLTAAPPPPSSIVAMAIPSALSCNSYTTPPPTMTTAAATTPAMVTTTSVTTQTPKTQKRVTIMEPTTHTFDPLLPTMVAVMQGSSTTNTAAGQVQQSSSGVTKININNSSSGNVNMEDTTKTTTRSGGVAAEVKEDATAMLDRISHDLNYLLNGAEDDDQIPPPPKPPMGSIPNESTTATNAEVIFSKKDVL